MSESRIAYFSMEIALHPAIEFLKPHLRSGRVSDVSALVGCSPYNLLRGICSGAQRYALDERGPTLRKRSPPKPA